MQAVSSSMRDFSAERTIPRVRDGSADALSAVYSEFGDSLMRLAYRITGSRADAEDVLHDVFLTLPEALEHYDERGSFDAWLKRITARAALTRLRKWKRAREVFLSTRVAAPPGAEADRLADMAAVERAIYALPDKLRLVFVLREVEGYTHAEIAELLQITPNASEVRLHRAIRSLRRTLGGHA